MATWVAPRFLSNQILPVALVTDEYVAPLKVNEFGSVGVGVGAVVSSTSVILMMMPASTEFPSLVALIVRV